MSVEDLGQRGMGYTKDNFSEILTKLVLDKIPNDAVKAPPTWSSISQLAWKMKDGDIRLIINLSKDEILLEVLPKLLTQISKLETEIETLKSPTSAEVLTAQNIRQSALGLLA